MNSQGTRAFRLGIVHGRFQPFHLEHLDYVLHALELCDRVVVGITNPDSTQRRFQAESDHRHLAEANPFTFYDRLRMVRESLLDVGEDWSRVAVVPFHVLDPELWAHYLPAPGDAVHLVRIFSDWELKKAEQFRAHGYEVVQIDEGAVKGMTATLVRESIAQGGDWESLVPRGTARVVHEVLGVRRG